MMRWDVLTLLLYGRMGLISQEGAGPGAVIPEASHHLQAAAFLSRWRNRLRRAAPKPAADRVPARVELPSAVWQHYRSFAWVAFEQRLVLLVLAALLVCCALVWTLALHLEKKTPVVVRAAKTLKEASVAYYGSPQVSYDQLAFFLHGCLPLLYTATDSGHPLLPLAQGLVDPEIYRAAEQRLNAAAADMKANQMTQSLTLTGLADVVADSQSGRAAAYVRGYLAVTVRSTGVTFFPWRAQVLVEANPVGRLNPYPFYVIGFDSKTGPEALAWDETHDNRSLLKP